METFKFILLIIHVFEVTKLTYILLKLNKAWLFINVKSMLCGVCVMSFLTVVPHPTGWMFMEAGFPNFPLPLIHSPQPSPQPPPRRKRSINPQQDDNFIQALEAVRYGGLGFCKAAKLYGVNNRTLWLEYKKRGYPILRPSTKNRNNPSSPYSFSSPPPTPSYNFSPM